MSKGSQRRPAAVPLEHVRAEHDRIFPPKPPAPAKTVCTCEHPTIGRAFYRYGQEPWRCGACGLTMPWPS